MRNETALYAMISGTAETRPIREAITPDSSPGHRHAATIVDHLVKSRVNPAWLCPPRIDVVTPSEYRPRGHLPTGYWFSPETLTVDFILRIQRGGHVERWIDSMRYDARHCSDEVLQAMSHARSCERGAALLAASVGEELLRDIYPRPEAPWDREPDLCRAITHELRSWAKEGLATPDGFRFHHDDGLFRTPVTMAVAATNDIAADFLHWIAMRMVFCLELSRPAILRRVETPPNQIIADLLAIAEGKGAPV